MNTQPVIQAVYTCLVVSWQSKPVSGSSFVTCHSVFWLSVEQMAAFGVGILSESNQLMNLAIPTSVRNTIQRKSEGGHLHCAGTATSTLST